jgi:hypothetical protein
LERTMGPRLIDGQDIVFNLTEITPDGQWTGVAFGDSMVCIWQ